MWAGASGRASRALRPRVLPAEDPRPPGQQHLLALAPRPRMAFTLVDAEVAALFKTFPRRHFCIFVCTCCRLEELFPEVPDVFQGDDHVHAVQLFLRQFSDFSLLRHGHVFGIEGVDVHG